MASQLLHVASWKTCQIWKSAPAPPALRLPAAGAAAAAAGAAAVAVPVPFSCMSLAIIRTSVAIATGPPGLPAVPAQRLWNFSPQ